MNNPAPQLFTPAQIAIALGRKRQALARALESVPPSGKRIVAGNEANAWLFSALPSRLQTELSEQAARRGFRTVEQMLEGDAHPFAEAFEQKLRTSPLSQMRAEFISRAMKLRDALAAPLVQQHTINTQQLTELGLREFNRVFGYAISAKQWNRLFDRTVLRDNGAEQFHRTELYLDDAAFTRPIAAMVSVARHYDHSVLNDVFAHVENKERPTAEDRVWVFDAAFRHFESLCATTTRASEHAQMKASLVAHLFSALPGLAKRVPALRRSFDRKFQTWIEGERATAALQDDRKTNSGNFRRPDFSEDVKKIRDLTYQLHGNESLAYRRLRKRGELSDAFVNYYPFNIRVSKSAVPDSVRAEVTPQIEAAIDQYKGEREARLRGPAIPRNWSDTLPGDYYSGDDTNLNHPFSTPNDQGGLDILRGEFLLLNDLRSSFPLDHQLIAGHYNGRHVVSGLGRVEKSPGLARKGGYWERGIWESRWMPGVPKKHSVHWRETELRLRAAGFSMGPLDEWEQRHAISPRSKPIERMFGIIQSLMTDKAPFLGRNERSDNFKPLQDFIARCRRGTEDPRNEGIMPMEHWLKKVTEVLEEYADEPQNGKMLPGVSPREMWEDGLAKRPLLKLDPAQRIGLATNRRIIKRIQNTGIVLPDVPQLVYANEELRHWQMRGREIVVFYNIDVPDLLTVANRELTEFFTIKGVGLPAMTATSDQLREASQQIRGFMKPARVLHAQITQRHQFTVTRDADPELPSTRLGEFHNAEVAAHQKEKSARTRKLHKIQTAAAVSGATVGPHVRNPDRVLQGIELEQEARARLAAKEQQP